MSKTISKELLKKSIVFCATLLLVNGTYANPVGGVVTSGSATISSPNATTLQIKQNSNQAIINWNSFNIAPNETTNFVQPSSSSIALNRINPNQGASQIYGHLNANGRIILINGAGIYFGPNSFVNVGGIIASTSDISDKNFLNGNYVFDQPSIQHGSIVNEGQIIAKDYGLVALAGSSVSNQGLIQAHLGNVVLASGDKYTLSLNGDQLINFTVDQATSSAGVDRNGNRLKNAVNNSGTILADGGSILMTAKAAQQVVDNVINMSGVVEARSVQQKNGEIILLGQDTGGTGNVVVSGKIDTTGVNAKGGTAKILGDHVQLASSAVVDASGDQGGGIIDIGGDSRGQGPDYNAATTTIAAGANIAANARTTGNGGNIVVWSNNNTQVQGNLSATGGPQGGNGGNVETSGGYLDVNGATVNLKATSGQFGTWLLDPTSIFIADSQANATAVGMTGTDATANQYSGTSPYTFNASGTGAESLLTTSSLLAALANGNVVVTTDNSSAAGSGDIYVVNNILWSNPTSLTLSAYRHIVLQGNIENAAAANIKLIADNTGTGVGSVCGGGGTSVCGGIDPSITVVPSGFVQSFFSTLGAVSIYYNPKVFGAQDTIYTGGSTPLRYMLINSLGNPTDTTTASLASLANNINNFNSSFANGNFALSNNIDASATATAPWSSSGFLPIGTGSLNFTGRFDGLGHTISNLYINSTTSNTGLFGVIGSQGKVSNINLFNPNISSTGLVLGAIAGSSSTSSTITNVSSSGGSLNELGSGGFVGLVGSLNGVLSNSYNSTPINANNLSFVFANNFIGGLAGLMNSTASITNSYNVGTISVASTGSSTIAVGGLVGENASSVSQSISNSYNIGNVVANNTVSTGGDIGGAVGVNEGQVTDVYNLGHVSSTNFTGASGGLVGSNSSSLSNSFWDTALTGQANAVGSGNTCPSCGSSNLQLTSTYSNAGWNIGAPGSGSTWQILDNVIYPHLVTEGLYTIQGTIYSDSAGTTPAGPGITVNLAVNGALPITTTTNGSSQYSYLFSTSSANPVPNGNLPIGSNILIYPSSGSFGNLVFQTNGLNVSSADILNDTLRTGVTNGNGASNSILASAIGLLADPSIGFSVLGNNITTSANISFKANTNYRLDGNISTANVGDITFNAPLTLVNPSTSLQTINGNVTFNGINGSSKNLSVETAGPTASTINFNTVNNAAQSINIIGSFSNNDTLRFLDDPSTQNWQLGTSFSNTDSITGLAQIGNFTFSHIQNLIGTGTMTAPNISINSWNVTGPSSGTVTIIGSTYNFSGFSTLKAASDAESVNTFTIQPSGYIQNIIGAAGNTQTNVDFSAYSGPLTLTETNITTPNGVTNLSNINVVGNDGTTGTNSTVIGNDFTLLASNSGTFTGGGLRFSGFGNLSGLDGGDTFTFLDGSHLSGNITAGTGTNTIDTTNYLSPVNFTFAHSGSGGHGVQGFGDVLGGTFDNIDVINNNSDPNSTLSEQNGITGLFPWELNGVASGTVMIGGSSDPFTFSGFPNINGATGAVTNVFSINPGADFNSLYGGGDTASQNQFILFGGNVNFIDGGLSTVSTLLPMTSTPSVVNITGPSSGSVTGGATVGSFINISVIQQGSSGTTYNVNSTLPVLAISNSSNVIIGTSGNVGTVDATLSNNDTYNISGTVGSLLSGTGINSYTLNNGANVTSLSGSGSDNLTLNTSGNNIWNVNGTSGSVSGGGATIGSYSGITNLIGGNGGNTFNLDGTLNSVTGGSGNDTFQLAATSSVGNINGGAGTNTLKSAPGNSTWNISGPNSGSVGGAGGFSNIQNMVGSATGLNTFIFTGSGSVGGLIDGGNLANVNVINASGKSQSVDLVLSPKSGGVLQDGTLSAGGSPFATFTEIQSAIGNGGTITVPDASVSSITLNTGSTNAGIVGDPFIFNGFIPIQLVPGSPTVLAPLQTTSTSDITNVTAVLIIGDLINVPQSYFVEQNLEDLINSQTNEDIQLLDSTSFCFR